VERYNDVKDIFAGHQKEIQANRDWKFEVAREQTEESPPAAA